MFRFGHDPLAGLLQACFDPAMGTFREYGSYDALGLAELVRNREVTPLELVDAAVARIEAVDAKLHAVVTPMFEEARRIAAEELPDGPFRGVPFLLKDLRARYAGVRLSEGSRYWREHVPGHDSEIVTRYRRAGLIVVGKTNTPEYGLLPVTENAAFGETHTPWSLGRTSGGSSGGSAAAVAAGVVPMAHASDGGGSIRIPASCCGIFGFKPTRGRTPTGPDDSEGWHGYAIDHAVSRTVRDSAALLDVTHGPERYSPYWPPPIERPFLEEVGTPPGKLRIAFTSQPMMPSTVHREAIEAVESTAELCEELGHEVAEATISTNPDDFARHFFVIVAGATAAAVIRDERTVGRPALREDLEPVTWLTVMLGKQFTAEQFSLAVQELQLLSRLAADFFNDWDVLLTPATARPPVLHGELQAKGFEALLQRTVALRDLRPVLRLPGLVDQAVRRVFDFVPWTALANVAGLPSMSVPLYFDRAGLPLGSMFTAGFGRDDLLFRLAAQLEEARPWARRRPPVHAFDLPD